MAPLYRLENLGKKFAGEEHEIFHGLNLTISQGETVAIVGSSGSGKSTLLHIMGALDKPTSGRVLYEDRDLAKMKVEEQARFRNLSLGFVFQFHHLLPEFTALENVALPGLIAGRTLPSILPEARALLCRVGLEERMESKPTTLSGGERQRAAIARALLMKPKVILADEPTGNLDAITGHKVAELLFELNKELGMTLVVVTHNRELATGMDRILELKGGELYEIN